jgi:hypothetical protein
MEVRRKTLRARAGLGNERIPCCYNLRVFPKILAFALGACLVCASMAQEPGSQPPVKVHVLNVCSPSAEEQREISAALEHLPKNPAFSSDFEVDRGRSLLDRNAEVMKLAGAEAAAASAAADFVRIRREFDQTAYSNVQYSFSRDEQQMVETLVFRLRDPKDLLEISIENSASAVARAAAMLAAPTAANRIKLERFGKSSVVLARCAGGPTGPPPDQSAYEPLFRSASAILSAYRDVLGAKKMVPAELARIQGSWPPRSARKPSTASARR